MDEIQKKLLQSIEKHCSAQPYQGKDIDAMGRWPGKPHFELCPDMWFWGYQTGNSVYPNMMSVSSTPFWSDGQAKLDLLSKIRRLENHVARLSDVKVKEAERNMLIITRELDEARKDHLATLINLAEMGIETGQERPHVNQK